MRIVRKIEIDYGHTLPRHIGFCNQIHGHRGVVECMFQGDLVENTTNSANGMVLDFAVCKKIMMEEIHTVLDHGFAIWNNEKADRVPLNEEEILDELKVMSTLAFIKLRNSKVLELSQPPTAEVLGKYFFRKVTDALKNYTDGKIKLVELVWHETPNNKAIVNYEDILYDSD